METIEARVLDPQHLKLSQRLNIPPGSKIFITITPAKDLAGEHDSWTILSRQGLASAYGEQEPEYSSASIKEHNPEFQP